MFTILIIFSGFPLTTVAMILSFVTLLRSACCTVSWSLPLCTAVPILLCFLILYAGWLDPPPLVAPSCSNKCTTSALHSTAISSAAIVCAEYHVQFWCTATFFGSGCFHFALPSCLEQCHVSLYLCHLPLSKVLLLGYLLTIIVSCFRHMHGAECFYVRQSYPPCLVSKQLKSAVFLCQSVSLRFVHVLSADWNVIPIPRRAYSMCVAIWCPMYQCTSKCNQTVLTQSVWYISAVAFQLVVAAHEFDVAPHTSELAEPVGACIYIRLDIVAFSYGCHSLMHRLQHHILPSYYKNHW